MIRSIFIVFALTYFCVAGCGGDGAIELNVKIEPSVKVFKSRGSVQCTGGGTAPEVMENELITAGIEVRSFSCGIDGLVYAAVCGAPDGAINIFDIPQSRTAQAQSLGFASLSTLLDAQETQCR